MAIVGTDQDDDSTLAQPTTSSSANAHAGQGNAAGGFVGGTGTGSGQGATTGVASSAAGQTPGGGGYANLSQYLQANQGSGATTGQAAENVVQQSGDAAKQAQNTYSTDANNDISNAASGLGVNQNTLGQISSGTQNVSQDYMNQINSGSYSYSPNQTALNNLGGASQKTLDSMISTGKNATGYNGPTDFSQVQYGGPSYGTVAVNYGGPTTTSGFTGHTAQDQLGAMQANNAVAGNVQNAQGGQSGVSALLKNAYQQPNYTAGENSLDAFLAGGTAGGQQALSQAAGVGQDVSNNYSQINNALTNQIQGAQQTATNTNTAYQNAINTANQTSDQTRAQYYAAAQAAQAKSLADQQAAQAAASKAQGEEDTRAKTAAAAAAAKAKTQANVSETGTVASDQSLSGNPFQQVAGAANGNQKDINALATDALTHGVSAIAPNQVGAVTSTAQKIASPVQNQLNKVTNPATNLVNKTVQKPIQSGLNNLKKHLGFRAAHGGEVPSYSQIQNMLKRK